MSDNLPTEAGTSGELDYHQLVLAFQNRYASEEFEEAMLNLTSEGIIVGSIVRVRICYLEGNLFETSFTHDGFLDKVC